MVKKNTKMLKYKHLKIETVYVEFKNKSDTSNNRDNWNHLKIIQKISKRHKWKPHQ